MLSRFLINRDDYVIIKMSDMFPAYVPGSDIDILCRDTIKFAEHIQEIEPYTFSNVRGTHLQVDWKWGKKLIVKFDLIDSVKEYGLDADEVFDKRHMIWRRGFGYFVPAIGHELQIRGVEYRKNRKKTWHKDFIERHGASGLFLNLESRVKV